MNGHVQLYVVGVLVFGLLVGATVAIYRYRMVSPKRRALRRRRDIERATRVAERRIRAYYQQAAWAAVQHMVEQYSARANRQ